MSCITESLARGLANNVKRDAADRFRKAQGVLDTYCTIPHAKGPIWRYAVGWARELIAPVIFERHSGEKARAVATFIGVETQFTVPGIAFTITELKARALFKGQRDFARDIHIGAYVTKHAQCRAMQALGSDVRAYGRELVKHAVIVERYPDVAATFSENGIALWTTDNAFKLPTCTTFIPADRLDKWSAPYARWQSGRDVDGVVSAARTMDEVIAMGGAV